MISFGCQKERASVIKPKAEFDFKADGITAPFKVQFTNKSLNSISYLWLFDNLDTSTAQNPEYTFANPGYYQISLIVCSSTKSYDTLTKTISLGDASSTLPVAMFDVQFIGNKAPCLIQFSNESTDATEFNWDFGDGTKLSSTALTVDHIFQAGGSYKVEIEAVKQVYIDNKLSKFTSKYNRIITIINKPSYFVVDTFTYLNTGFFPNSKIPSYGAYPLIYVWNCNGSQNFIYGYKWGNINMSSSDKPNILDLKGDVLSTQKMNKTDTLWMEFRLIDNYDQKTMIDYSGDYQFGYQFWPKNGSGLPYSNRFTLNKSNFMLKGHWE